MERQARRGEVRPDVERELVAARREFVLFEERRLRPPVGVRHRGLQPPQATVRLDGRELDAHTRGRPAARGVEHVGGERTVALRHHGARTIARTIASIRIRAISKICATASAISCSSV